MPIPITPASAVEPIHETIISKAEALLSNRFGGTPTITGAEILDGSGDSTVLRLRLASNPYLQERTVVVKHSPAGDDDHEAAGFVREVVAYQFTTSLPSDVRPGPTLLAYDTDERILVISDCGDVDTFAYLMDRSDPDQKCVLLRRLGRAIGLLHQASADHEDQFDVLFSRMLSRLSGSTSVHRRREESLVDSIDYGADLLVREGITIDDTVAEFIRDAKRRLMSGQHRAFTPFDLSPDNIVYSDKPEFLDYEWAGFRDATFDVASVIAGFPQFVFGHQLSDAETDVFIEAWRHEVCLIWPNVNNPDRLRARILTALIGWAVMSLWHLNCGDMGLLTDVPADHTAEPPTVDSVDEATAKLGWSARTKVEGTDTDLAELRALALRDIQETCEALVRYAERGDDPRFPAVAAFGRSILERFSPPTELASAQN